MSSTVCPSSMASERKPPDHMSHTTFGNISLFAEVQRNVVSLVSRAEELLTEYEAAGWCAFDLAEADTVLQASVSDSRGRPLPGSSLSRTPRQRTKAGAQIDLSVSEYLPLVTPLSISGQTMRHASAILPLDDHSVISTILAGSGPFVRQCVAVGSRQPKGEETTDRHGS